jgi:preprotein translocase subunit YajC
MMGRGVIGTVTEVAADHYSIKTEMGEMYTVRFGANTRITKQPTGMRGPGGGGQGTGGGGGYGRDGNGGGGNPPQQINAADIKVGDAIAAAGDIDATAKSVGATRIVQFDPDTAKRMQEMAANYGKTWLQPSTEPPSPSPARSTTPRTPWSPTKTPPSAGVATPLLLPIFRLATLCAPRAPSRRVSLLQPP